MYLVIVNQCTTMAKHIECFLNKHSFSESIFLVAATTILTAVFRVQYHSNFHPYSLKMAIISGMRSTYQSKPHIKDGVCFVHNKKLPHAAPLCNTALSDSLLCCSCCLFNRCDVVSHMGLRLSLIMGI